MTGEKVICGNCKKKMKWNIAFGWSEKLSRVNFDLRRKNQTVNNIVLQIYSMVM